MKRLQLTSMPWGAGVTADQKFEWIRDNMHKIDLASRREDDTNALNVGRYYGAVVYDPPNLAAGAADAIQTITVTGAALGDFVDASFSLDRQGLDLIAWVSAANTVKYMFFNPTSGALNLASGTVRVRVWKYFGTA